MRYDEDDWGIDFDDIRGRYWEIVDRLEDITSEIGEFIDDLRDDRFGETFVGHQHGHKGRNHHH